MFCLNCHVTLYYIFEFHNVKLLQIKFKRPSIAFNRKEKCLLEVMLVIAIRIWYYVIIVRLNNCSNVTEQF